MNWRRGLFRLWIVGSALFVIAVAFVSYGDIKREFNAAANAGPWGTSDEVLVPQICGDARGIAGTDYSIENRFEEPDNVFDRCWYVMSKFRRLYPEYNNLTDKELTRKLYPGHGFPAPTEPNPWATVGMWAGIALGIPLAVLVLGSSLVWAFSGFAARRN
jgi:hypothetical protein